MISQRGAAHNIRMHLTGYSGLRPLPPAGDAGRYAETNAPFKASSYTFFLLGIYALYLILELPKLLRI